MTTKMCGSFPYQTLFLSEETKDEVELELLDEMALLQMLKIKVRDARKCVGWCFVVY